MDDLDDDVLHPWLRLPLIVVALLVALVVLSGLWRFAGWFWEVVLP